MVWWPCSTSKGDSGRVRTIGPAAVLLWCADPTFILASIARQPLSCLPEGRLFKVRNPYRLRSMNDMQPAVQVAAVNFLREPGFYFGAAYVNYAMTVALWVAVLVALYVFGALGMDRVHWVV